MDKNLDGLLADLRWVVFAAGVDADLAVIARTVDGRRQYRLEDNGAPISDWLTAREMRQVLSVAHGVMLHLNENAPRA